MITFPNCKINLGLNIIARRSDGFHNLETVFFPLAFKDALEIIPGEKTELTITGIPVDGKPEDNLCLKAYNFLKRKNPELPPLKIYLYKTIPIGAGLGGGSADGAFMLKLLNEKFNLNLSDSELINYAEQLGSDCPFFILNRPCFASGRGEILEEINLNLTSKKILLVHPGVHINTKWAFSKINPEEPVKSLKEIIQQPIATWRKELKNNFEAPVFLQYPEIKKIKDNLYDAGAEYSSMTGSGSAVYGIFKIDTPIPALFSENYFVRELIC